MKLHGAERQNVPTAGENCVCGELPVSAGTPEEQAEVRRNAQRLLQTHGGTGNQPFHRKCGNRPQLAVLEAGCTESSGDISPDYAYDDGRYARFIQSVKEIPNVFVMNGMQETLTNPVIRSRRKFTAVGVVDKRVLFYVLVAEQVVGIENRGLAFEEIRLPAGDTVSC